MTSAAHPYASAEQVTHVFVPVDGALESPPPGAAEAAYPERTALRCWWDHHPFDTEPVGIIVGCNPHMVLHVVSTKGNRVHTVPEGLTRSEAARLEGRPDVISTDEFPSEGVFCSYACAFAYSRAFYRPDYRDFSMLYQTRWRLRNGGAEPPRLVAAPPYVLLKAYGGHLSIEEYRAQLGALRVEDSMGVHNPAGYLARTQRVYSIYHVWPQNHAIRQQRASAAAAAALPETPAEEPSAADPDTANGDDDASGPPQPTAAPAIVAPPPARPRAPRARPEKRKRQPAQAQAQAQAQTADQHQDPEQGPAEKRVRIAPGV